MLLHRRINEYRSATMLAVLVLLSLASLASGTRGGVVHQGVETVVTLAAHPFWKAFNAASGAVGYVAGLIFSYHAARQEAVALEFELAATVPRLAERDELAAENERLRAMMAFRREHPGLTLLPSEVISRSGGMLNIDRGSLHGVEEFMCAITKDGVVGVVTRVEPTLSWVATLHSADCKIGAMIRRNRATGMVHGSGSAFSHICAMHYIDLKDKVLEGDEVVTSDWSAHPAGLPIGVVTGTEEEGALQWTAYLEPVADPYRVDEVFLVLRAQTPTEHLTGVSPALDCATNAHAMPDDRPMPERFAP